MDAELIDDWGTTERVEPPKTRAGARYREAPTATVGQIVDKLKGFKPPILNVHCYEDVGYPWVQVVFTDLIGPEVALRVGQALAAAAGESNVYFNSLRPQAVLFLLEPAFQPQPELPVSRYGAPLADIRAAWNGTRQASGNPRQGTKR